MSGSPDRAQVEKLVIKTAVRTVLVLLILLVAAFAVLSFGFPGYMSDVTRNLGAYDMALAYCRLNYSYTGDSMDLADCFELCVLTDDDGGIISSGEELVLKPDFADVCKNMEQALGELSDEYLDGEQLVMDYSQRVKGKLAAAYYRADETIKAIDYAFAANGADSFRSGNALIALSAEIRTARDGDAAALLLEKLAGISPSVKEESALLTEVMQSLRSVVVSDK